MSDSNVPISAPPAGPFSHAPADSTEAPSYPTRLSSPAAGASEKSFIATWLLSWLIGYLGVDRFYLGKIGTGVIKLLTLGGAGIWWLIDLILTLTGNATDARGAKVRPEGRQGLIAWLVTGAAVLLSIVIGANSPRPVPQSSSPAAEATDAPTADGSAVDRALPAGSELNIQGIAVGDVSIVMGAVTWDANDVIKAENVLLGDPKEGMKFIVVNVTMTNNGDDSTGACNAFTVDEVYFYGPTGAKFDPAFAISTPDWLCTSTVVEGGVTVTGNVAFEVPSDADYGVWYGNGVFVNAE